MENWKNINGFIDVYQVSDLGNVRSVDRIIIRNGRVHKLKGRILKYHIDIHGYKSVVLSKLNKLKTFRVHRLVAKEFLNHTCSRTLHIDHVNENKTDNRVKNLQILTASENTIKGIKHRKTSSSQFTGVYWRKDRCRWVSRKVINGVDTYLGSFLNEFDAHNCYESS